MSTTTNPERRTAWLSIHREPNGDPTPYLEVAIEETDPDGPMLDDVIAKTILRLDDPNPPCLADRLTEVYRKYQVRGFACSSDLDYTDLYSRWISNENLWHAIEIAWERYRKEIDGPTTGGNRAAKERLRQLAAAADAIAGPARDLAENAPLTLELFEGARWDSTLTEMQGLLASIREHLDPENTQN